jgi:hypothetical protein
MAVITGLKQASIIRLSETISLVSAKRLDTFHRLEKLMSGSKNYGNYRLKLEAHCSDFLNKQHTSRETLADMSKETFQNAVVPHLGAHLAEISSIMEGNQDYLTEHSNFLNLDKKKLLYNCISKLTLIRNQRYNLHNIRIIQNVINQTIMKYIRYSSADIEIETSTLMINSISLESSNESKHGSDIDINDDINEDDNDDDNFIDDISEDLFDEDSPKKSRSVAKSFKKTVKKLASLLRR